MSASRAVTVAAALALATAASASAQTPSAPARPLPSGVTVKNGVMMMAPISGSESSVEQGPVEGTERRESSVPLLAASDHDLYMKAFEAARRGDWIAARGLADQGHDPVARKLIQWRYLLDKNSGATFNEIDGFLKANPDWPARDTLYARAEKAMPPDMDPNAVLFWFGNREPVTGIGRVRLGEAMMATGRITAGKEEIRRAWIENTFDPEEEFQIVQKHGDLFTPDVDRQRLNNLLWHDDLTDAQHQLARLSASDQQLARARITLRTNLPAGERMVSALPQSLRSDPNLIFDQARLLRRVGNPSEEPAALLRAPTREYAKLDPDKWWGELNIATRQAMQDANYRTAYALVNDSGLTDGQNFAEAEFMAGWIALRYLNDPHAALAHFQKLASNVTRPISAARAHYWAGRAYEAAGDLGGAWREYRLAAQNSETFYGQLALTRIDATPHLHLNNVVVNADGARAAYEESDLPHAMHVLGDLGELPLLRVFATHYAETHPDPKYIKLLASDMVRSGFREVALRVAKTASYENILMLEYSHPVIALPAYRGPGDAPDPALVLGLIRQETEFDPTAVSSAGAMGLMQMMPASARRAAAEAHLAYRPNALVSDTTYNVQLGMTELSEHLGEWGGSYILAIASYNAGPTNVRHWMELYGDPRSPSVDPIDWIEQIPFTETRNYVQRVLENTEVYRNRLSGRDQPLQIMADLYRPNAPKVSVIPYAPQASSVPTPEPKPGQIGDNGSGPEVATRTPSPEPKPETAPAITPKIKPGQ